MTCAAEDVPLEAEDPWNQVVRTIMLGYVLPALHTDPKIRERAHELCDSFVTALHP